MIAVERWSGREARVLREALRMSQRVFAERLGVSHRTISKWEAGGRDLIPVPDSQGLLDTALAQADSAAQARFAAAVGDPRTRNTGPVEASSDLAERNREGALPKPLTAPVPPSRVLLPVVIDGSEVLLPLDPSTVAGRGLAMAVNMASSLADLTRPEDKPARAERAYELYLRGQSLLATNERHRVEAATTLLDRALDIDPGFARAQAARGYAQWRQYFSGWGSDLSTLEAALGDVDSALRLEPESIGAHTTLVRICWDMGWHARALEVGRALYERKPDSLDATLAFARALNNCGMAEAAVPLTQEVLRIDPTNPTALKLLMWNYLMIGEHASALDVAHRYLPTSPRDSNTRWAVALAHLCGGDIQNAIEAARDAVSADPEDVTAWSLLGYTHRHAGDETAARDAWSKGIEHVAAHLTPGSQDNPRVQSWLASIEACLGYTEPAREKVGRISAAAPHNGYLKYRLAHVLAELGDAEAAVTTLREAIQDGFLSVQLLRQEERLGLASLVGLADYRRVRQILQQNVARLKATHAPHS